MDIDETLGEIELLREKLHRIGERKSLLDQEVVKTSQQLDDLLNVYQKILNEKYK